MTQRAFVVLTAALVVTSVNLAAIFTSVESGRVPIQRLVANLERELQADPKNVQTLVNLARLHAMAHALKIEEFPVAPLGKNKADVPWFGHESGYVPRAVRPAASPEQAAEAERHLKAAIRRYEAALALDPQNLTARLGYAWVLQQAGDKQRAISEYRRLIEQAWPTEQKVKGLMPTQRLYTPEAVGYLIPLLDSERDAAEIKDLRSKQEQLQRLPRAITPIAIPLEDDLPSHAILDPLARVRFDADGSGLAREWTWLTRDAGWLVYDAQDRGEISSALQWFGNVTFWLFWSNGYEALRALDDNGDGELAGAELQHLAIWHDRNRNGLSEAGEVRPVASHGIVALSCTYVHGDGSRFAAVSSRGVQLSDGRTRPTYDVILKHATATLTRR